MYVLLVCTHTSITYVYIYTTVHIPIYPTTYFQYRTADATNSARITHDRAYNYNQMKPDDEQRRQWNNTRRHDNQQDTAIPQKLQKLRSNQKQPTTTLINNNGNATRWQRTQKWRWRNTKFIQRCNDDDLKPGMGPGIPGNNCREYSREISREFSNFKILENSPIFNKETKCCHKTPLRLSGLSLSEN